MDVTRWIEDLAGESHQHHASQPRFPDFMLPKANVEPFKRRKDQKRSRISGETFLEALPVPLEASKARDGGKPGCSRRSCSSAHDSDVVSSSSSYKYHKQVRKKPRADLYERKSLRGARNEATKKSKASRVEPETGGRKQQRKPTKSSRPVNQSKIKNPAEHLNRLTVCLHTFIGRLVADSHSYDKMVKEYLAQRKSHRITDPEKVGYQGLL